MAQTLLRFDTPVTHRDGRLYRAQACGRERDNGQWEAWLEFEEIDTGTVLRSQRETTQPNQYDAAYWATGLTPVYLEGSLDRILHPPSLKLPDLTPPPYFDGPAPHARLGGADRPDRAPVLNPFSVYEKNPDLLAQELTALRAYHLRQIIRDFDLAHGADRRLNTMTERALASLIVRRVREVIRSRGGVKGEGTGAPALTESGGSR